jgi:AraC-like DNA-binding protein
MAETNALLAGQEPTLNIEDEVIFLDSLNEVETLSTLSPVKMDYNAIVHCRRGRVLLELGGSQQVKVTAGQMLLVPAQKLMHPMMVSTDVDAGVLLVSDSVLKSVLGTQIDIWNRAMYLHETYVIDISRWSHAMESHAHSVFKGENLALFREFVLAFLRVYLLIVCEELLQQSKTSLSGNVLSTDREKRIFSSFLDLLQHEQLKRRQVSYYAERLCITSKYLSTICRNVSGKSPMRWITDSVMEDCYALLRNTNLSVKEISIRLGFPNSSFFGQYFREQAAQTPMGYRNKYRSQL